MTRVAVVTIAHARWRHLVRQRRALWRSSPAPDDYVVVAMDDADLMGWRPRGPVPPTLVPVGGNPSGLPLSAARNAGARTAISRGADILVFLDVDCLPAPDLVAGYTHCVATCPEVVWSGPVTYLAPPVGGYPPESLGALDDPHPARPAPARGEAVRGADPDLFWSLSFAVHRTAWEMTGGFCEEYVGYGGEDTDFGRTARAAGLDLGWTGDARAYHQHHPVESPPVRHLHDIVRNGALFQRRWGHWPMMGWLEEFEQRGLVRREGAGWVLRDPPAGHDPGGAGYLST